MFNNCNDVNSNDRVNQPSSLQQEDYKGSMSRGRAVRILTEAAKNYSWGDTKAFDRVLKVAGLVALAGLVGTVALTILFPIVGLPFAGMTLANVLTTMVFGFAATTVAATITGGITTIISFFYEKSKIEKLAKNLFSGGKLTDSLSVQDMQNLTDQAQQASIRWELWKEYNSKAIANMPACFRCSLTNGILVDPVVTDDGNTYERSAMMAEAKQNPYFQKHWKAVPNRALKEAIEAYKQDRSFPDQKPSYFECSISGEIMTDPVIDPYGNTYERDQILERLKHHSTEPRGNKPLRESQLVPNLALKNAITAWRKRNS